MGRNRGARALAGTLLMLAASTMGAVPVQGASQTCGFQWVARHHGAIDASGDYAYAVALSPDGRSVFVAGDEEDGFGTLSLDAATGTVRWSSHWDRVNGSWDVAYAVVVSPDGARVYVLGLSLDGPPAVQSRYDYVTVAYDAGTGAELWTASLPGPDFEEWWPTKPLVREHRFTLGVSPDGARVFVAGFNWGGTGAFRDYVAVAYDATSGAELWRTRYDAHQDNDILHSLAVSPAGDLLVLTGQSTRGGAWEYETVALNASTGAASWSAHLAAGGSGGATALHAAFSPDGRRAYVTGSTWSGTPGNGALVNATTVAYDASNGAEVWRAAYDDAGTSALPGDKPVGVRAGPDGRRVYVEVQGEGGAFATVAYDAATGAQDWVARYPRGSDARDVAVSPDGARVFVTGSEYGSSAAGDTQQDFAVLAYDAATGSLAWSAYYERPTSNPPWARVESPNALAVSPAGDRVVVTGLGARSTGWTQWTYDYATVSVDATAGPVAASAGGLRIVAPAGGGWLRGTVEARGEADSATPLRSMTFSVDCVTQADVRAPPHAWLWDTRGWSDGFHTLALDGVDALGARHQAVLPVNLDNTPPVTVAAIGAPKYEGARVYVTGATPIELVATDAASGVAQTRFRTDAGGEWQPYRGVLHLQGPDGAYALRFSSVDVAGNVEPEGAVDLFLDNTPPDVGFARPPKGSVNVNDVTVAKPATGQGAVDDLTLAAGRVTVAVATVDAGSGVGRVDVLVDGSHLGTLTAPPYEFVWDTRDLPAGSHDLAAVSTDQVGNSATTHLTVTTVPAGAEGLLATVQRGV